MVKGIEIRWHAVGISCLRLGIAFGTGFFFIALFNRITGFETLTQMSPWIPKYIGDSIAFAVGLIMIFRISLVGPVLMHNVVDGLLYSADLLLDEI
jgi:hypothetical protein